MSTLDLLVTGAKAMIRPEFWDIEVDEYENPGLDEEMKEHANHAYEVVTMDSRNKSALLDDGYWYHFAWIIPMVDEDTLFEMYVTNQIDENEYEEAKEVIANA